MIAQQIPPATLAAFAAVLRAAKDTQSRLEKRAILSAYLQPLSDPDLALAATFLCGRPFPRYQNRKLSAGGAVLKSSLFSANPSVTEYRLAASWLRHSDFGEAAAEAWADTPALPPELTLADVHATFSALETARGTAEKTDVLVTAFQHMDAPSLRAFCKVMLSETRMGVQEGTVEDAVAALSGLPLDQVRAANRHRADIGSVAVEARNGTLQASTFQYFVPVDSMLAHPTENTDEVLRRLQPPIWVEDKYDGVRCQLHKRDREVRLFSRDRKDITRQFPDVVDAWAPLPGSFALDGEIMILEGGQSMPFARLQQRLNRVAPTQEALAAHPAALVVFDLLAVGTQTLLDMPLQQRRQQLSELDIPSTQLLAPVLQAHSADDLEHLFTEAQARGNEGLMCKDPQSPYASGRRGYQWLKVKKALESLDVVIVGAEWGHGKRNKVLSDYTFAVRDTATDHLVTIGKAYGGLTDVEIAEMTKRLLNITTGEYGRYRTVAPEVVLEVAFNGIQESRRHKSGYALRFPRILRIRTDKDVHSINTLDDVRQQYGSLSGAKPLT